MSSTSNERNHPADEDEDEMLAKCRCLVELGANVNQAMENGTNALLVAAQEGHCKIVQCQVGEYGVDVGQTGIDGMFPLVIAAKFRHLDVLHCLV
jgi:ankyrin repeat protein